MTVIGPRRAIGEHTPRTFFSALYFVTLEHFFEEEEQRKKMGPVDKNSRVYWQFFFLGLSSLLPWNFFITADSYWMDKFEPVPVYVVNGSSNTSCCSNETYPPNNQLQKRYRNFSALFAFLPQVMFTFYSTLSRKNVQERLRVYTGLILMALLFLITTIFVKINTDSFQTVFFAITMFTIFVINASSAFVTASIFGSAARFPPRYPQGIMAGQGMGGLFSAFSFIIAISVTNDPTNYALLFFIIALVFLLLAIFCYSSLENNDYYMHYKAKHSLGQLSQHNGADDILLDNGSNSMEIRINEDILPQASYLKIFKKISPQFFSVLFTFFVTLANFPAVTASIRSTSVGTAWSDKYFTPVACFLTFNLSDFIGRALPRKVSFPSKDHKRTLVVLCLSRAIFFFLFTFCNSQPRSHTEPIFMHDSWFIFFVFLFGLSNGYLATLAIKYAPQMVRTQNEQMQVGKMMSFAIYIGLSSGAGFSFASTSWI